MQEPIEQGAPGGRVVVGLGLGIEELQEVADDDVASIVRPWRRGSLPPDTTFGLSPRPRRPGRRRRQPPGGRTLLDLGTRPRFAGAGRLWRARRPPASAAMGESHPRRRAPGAPRPTPRVDTCFDDHARAATRQGPAATRPPRRRHRSITNAAARSGPPGPPARRPSASSPRRVWPASPSAPTRTAATSAGPTVPARAGMLPANASRTSEAGTRPAPPTGRGLILVRRDVGVGPCASGDTHELARPKRTSSVSGRYPGAATGTERSAARRVCSAWWASTRRITSSLRGVR